MFDRVPNESRYPRIDQVKFAEYSLLKNWSNMVCLGTPNYLNFFKGCLPQILRGPFLNTLTQLHSWLINVSDISSTTGDSIWYASSWNMLWKIPKNSQDHFMDYGWNCYHRKWHAGKTEVIYLSYSFSSWCSLKGHTYLSKLCFQVQVLVSICDLFVHTRHKRVLTCVFFHQFT